MIVFIRKIFFRYYSCMEGLQLQVTDRFFFCNAVLIIFLLFLFIFAILYLIKRNAEY